MSRNAPPNYMPYLQYIAYRKEKINPKYLDTTISNSIHSCIKEISKLSFYQTHTLF